MLKSLLWVIGGLAGLCLLTYLTDPAAVLFNAVSFLAGFGGAYGIGALLAKKLDLRPGQGRENRAKLEGALALWLLRYMPAPLITNRAALLGLFIAAGLAVGSAVSGLHLALYLLLVA